MKKKLSLTQKIFIGMGLGMVLGLILQNIPAGFVRDDLLLNGVIRFLGTGFVRAIQMLVVPLVFVSLVNGSSAMGDVKKVGRIGGKVVAIFMVTTVIGLVLAIIAGQLIRPGAGLDLSAIVTVEPTIGEPAAFVDTLLNMIPTNPISAMAAGQMLPIIVFAILLGVTISAVGEKAEPFKKVIGSLDAILMKLVDIIMLATPLGVFGLIATTFATTGFDAFVPLLLYMGSIILVLLIQAFVVYSSLLKGLSGLKLKPFFKKYAKMVAVPFSTASSNATIPVSMETMEKMGVAPSVVSFTIPLGATINMDGTAIKQGLAAMFIAQVFGIELTLAAIATIIATATLASIGTAGVPGVGLVTLSMVLYAVGLPVEGIGLIIGIDRLLDMSRTAVNVMGDCICTLIVAKSEGELDLDAYYSEGTSQPKKALKPTKA